jgi:tol-pal system protein YbgF
LSQNDYAGTEAAFSQLIDTYPKDPLAGNAQYWIGESYYRRNRYKNAADAFLKGYKKYKSGDKAPETLLKLGMSLAAVGQKDAACSTFG